MNSSTKTIAIIDDDLYVLRSLQRLLAAIGYATDSFATAQEFLLHVATCKADCLVLDIDLGNYSGLELARHPSVRALQLPIVFISGNVNEELRRQALELSGTPCVRKPFQAVEILWAIIKAIHAR